MKIFNGSTSLEVEKYRESIVISIDDPENCCTDNAYNGDSAAIELPLEDAKKLYEYLGEIL